WTEAGVRRECRDRQRRVRGASETLQSSRENQKRRCAGAQRRTVCVIDQGARGGRGRVERSFHRRAGAAGEEDRAGAGNRDAHRSEEHTSELQSRFDLVCRLLLEKKNKTVKQML